MCLPSALPLQASSLRLSLCSLHLHIILSSARGRLIRRILIFTIRRLCTQHVPPPHDLQKFLHRKSVRTSFRQRRQQVVSQRVVDDLRRKERVRVEALELPVTTPCAGAVTSRSGSGRRLEHRIRCYYRPSLFLAFTIHY